MKRKDLFYVCYISENNSSETVREYGHSKMGGLDRTSAFRGGCWERGADFFQGGCNFHIKIN